MQVSSQRSEGDVQAAYRALQQRYPLLLGPRRATILRADTGEHGVFYRAVVGPFDSPDEASQFCGSFKAAGGQCVIQRNSTEAPKAAEPPTGADITPPMLVLPSSISPKYSTESEGEARMHTCVDQYNANKATNANGGMKWIEKGGGYYTECNKKLKS